MIRIRKMSVRAEEGRAQRGPSRSAGGHYASGPSFETQVMPAPQDERRSRSGRMTGSALIIAAALLLSACGFKPMYATNGSGPAVSEEFARIAIDPIPDRLGQLVRNALIDRVTPLGSPRDPVYRLVVKVTEEREDVGLRQDASVTRANYRLNGDFQLVEIATDLKVITANARTATAYDVVQQDFSTVIAQQDAERRLSIELADEIRTRLSIYFSREEKKAPEFAP